MEAFEQREKIQNYLKDLPDAEYLSALDKSDIMLSSAIQTDIAKKQAQIDLNLAINTNIQAQIDQLQGDQS